MMKAFIRKCWNDLDDYQKNALKSEFVSQFMVNRAYREFYESMNTGRLINDSIFFEFLKEKLKIEISVEQRKNDSVEQGYHYIENLDCEPA